MLHVYHPSGCAFERHYILDLLLVEFLGVSYSASVQEGDSVRIQAKNGLRELILPDTFFRMAERSWLGPGTLPQSPIRRCDLSGLMSPEYKLLEPSLPVLYGAPLEGGHWWQLDDTTLQLGLDVFGSAFFLLSRYEEAVIAERDAMERFPATASLAHQEGFLHRPLVNEYLEVLWAGLRWVSPGLQRKSRESRVMLSHDVDWPLCACGRDWSSIARSAAGDLLRRRNARLALDRVRAWVDHRLSGRVHLDPANTFEFLMNVSEEAGLRSAFYFIAGHSGGNIDGVYTLQEPFVRSLLRQISVRGHEIGLHPSFNTFRAPQAIKHELDQLRRACAEEGIEPAVWGGRHHYLRWENPTTWRSWDQVGLHYDSTLGFADYVGFRAGTCYEYPVYDVGERRPLALRERPLIVMDVTLTEYMNLSAAQAVERIADLHRRCRLFAGDFTMLWHNSSLLTDRERKLYSDIVQTIAR